MYCSVSWVLISTYRSPLPNIITSPGSSVYISSDSSLLSYSLERPSYYTIWYMVLYIYKWKANSLNIHCTQRNHFGLIDLPHLNHLMYAISKPSTIMHTCIKAFRYIVASIFPVTWHLYTKKQGCVWFDMVWFSKLRATWKEMLYLSKQWLSPHQYTSSTAFITFIRLYLTHWGRDKMAAIFQCIFLNEILWI